MNLHEFLYRIKLNITILHEKLLHIDFSTPVNPYKETKKHEYVKYSASTGRIVKLLDKFNIDSTDSFIDIGCGKGKVIDMMYKFPFKRIDGCEYSTDLCEICKKNMMVRKRTKTQIYNSDITRFGGLDDYNYFYMFNPFVGTIMEQFLQNLSDSLKRNKRKIYIIYLNPKCHELLLREGTKLSFLGSWRGFNIYSNEIIEKT